MVAMDVFASAFGFDAKSDDVWTTLGKVTAVSGNTLSVLLGGSATPTECEAYCVAGVGDIVFVAISKGQARAIAAKGGMTDASAWRSILGLGSISTHADSDYLKRQPSGTAELPNDSSTSNGFPIVLSDTFANDGEISYMTKPDFLKLMGLDYATTTTRSDVMDAGTGITITGFSAARFGKMASLFFQWSYSSAITVPANGNIGDIVIGTLKTGWLPYAEVHGTSSGDGAGAAWYYITSNGNVEIGACEGTGAQRTISANTSFDFGITYILA